MRVVLSADDWLAGLAVRLRGLGAEVVLGDTRPRLEEILRGADVIVATGPPLSAATVRSLAETMGVPYVYATDEPDVLARPERDEVTTAAINAERARRGLPPIVDAHDYAVTDLPWLATDSLLDPWPPDGLDVVQTGTWILPDEGDLPDEVEDFLDEGEPPVYVGLPADRELIAGIRAAGCRAVLSSAGPGLDAADCLAVGEISHTALFKRVAAVVHSGGSGTTHTAARAGAPQVVLARDGQRSYWAERVTALGIGATGPSFEQALKTALAPESAACAAAVAAAMYPDGAAVAAEMLIEEYRR